MIDFLFNQPIYLELIQVRLDLQGKALEITVAVYFQPRYPSCQSTKWLYLHNRPQNNLIYKKLYKKLLINLHLHNTIFAYEYMCYLYIYLQWFDIVGLATERLTGP